MEPATAASPGAPVRARRPYTVGEEIASSVTHGVGAALSLIGLVVLVVASVMTGDTLAVVASTVYGVSLVLEYTASTLYHALPQPRAKHVFKILDHSGIYLLIAGTYTPFVLLLVGGRLGYTMFALVWALAFIGIAFEAFWTYRPGWVSAAVYLGMGWLALAFVKPLAATAPAGCLYLLVAGGIAYTIGTPFYAVKRVPYFHLVWHLFVLTGSILHYLAVLLYAIPARG